MTILSVCTLERENLKTRRVLITYKKCHFEYNLLIKNISYTAHVIKIQRRIKTIKNVHKKQ